MTAWRYRPNPSSVCLPSHSRSGKAARQFPAGPPELYSLFSGIAGRLSGVGSHRTQTDIKFNLNLFLALVCSYYIYAVKLPSSAYTHTQPHGTYSLCRKQSEFHWRIKPGSIFHLILQDPIPVLSSECLCRSSLLVNWSWKLVYDRRIQLQPVAILYTYSTHISTYKPYPEGFVVWPPLSYMPLLLT